MKLSSKTGKTKQKTYTKEQGKKLNKIKQTSKQKLQPKNQEVQ